MGEFWSGQKDSGIGQWPTGTPVFGFGRTYISLWQLCQGWELKDDRGRAGSTRPSARQKKNNWSESDHSKQTLQGFYIFTFFNITSNVLIMLQGDVSTGMQQILIPSLDQHWISDIIPLSLLCIKHVAWKSYAGKKSHNPHSLYHIERTVCCANPQMHTFTYRRWIWARLLKINNNSTQNLLHQRLQTLVQHPLCSNTIWPTLKTPTENVYFIFGQL